VIPELSEEDLALVDSIYARGKDRVIAEIAGEECKKTDLMTLRGKFLGVFIFESSRV